MEGLDASDSRRDVLSPDSNQVHVLIHLHSSLFYGSSANSSSTSNVDGLVDRHQELLFHLSFRHSEGFVHCGDKLFDGLFTKFWVGSIQGAES